MAVVISKKEGSVQGMNELVSVIIPVYKVEKYLKQCVDSVINQTYQKLQIIIVDDGSPDNCPRMCDEYQKMDSRITVIHKENAGLGMARNTGLEAAVGKYVIFIDSDDWIDSDYVECQVKKMKSENADLLIHGYKTCDMSGSFLLKFDVPTKGVTDNVIENVLYPTLAPADSVADDITLPIGAPFKMYLTEIIRNNDLQFNDERKCIAEDVFFNIEYMRLAKRAVFIDCCGYNYRTNPQSISHAYKPSRLDATFAYYEELNKVCRKYPNIMEKIEHRIERNYIGKCRAALRLIEASDMPHIEKVAETRKLLDNPFTMESLKRFPLQNYNKSLKVVAELMKRRMYRLTLFLFWIRKNCRGE